MGQSSEERKIFHIGTCGYSYADWEGSFYPEKLKKSEYLRFYSLVFDFVELDFSWYAMPRPEALEAMADQTNPDFRFAIKAHRSLTHEIDQEWRTQAQRFSEAAASLSERDRLAAVLIQLPYRFSYTADNRRYLGELCSELEGFPLVVEFRNDVWYKPSVFEELAKRKITLAIIDRPEVAGLPPETQILTTERIYYRLHGRNADHWWNGDAVSRYDYDYSEVELKARARWLASLGKRAAEVFVAFNNHAKGNAPKNAKTIRTQIEELFV